MADIIDPVFPKQRIPSFRHNDWTVEEVIQANVLCGHYDSRIIPNCSAHYPDSGKTVVLVFEDGNI